MSLAARSLRIVSPLRNLAVRSALLLVTTWLLAIPAGAQPPKPNIVFILADDLGINDLGVYGQNQRKANGQPYLSTPNLDTLARGGLRFNEMYAPATVCAPTRVSILTGFHGGHASVDSNGLNNNGGNAMRAVDYSFAQSLQSVGYTTGAFGKWGSGMNGRDLTPVATNDSGLINHPNPQVTHPDSTPDAKGFDEFYGYLNHIHAHNYYVEYLWEDNGPSGLQVDQSPTTNDYTHDLIADKSVNFIRNHAGDSEPFFMYGEYTIPHNDYDPPNDELLQMYTDPVSSGGQGLTGNQADYGAMVTRLDRTVGDIVQALRDPNDDGDESDSVIENTLIIFGTDNGPTSGANGWYDSNGIYRGTKNGVYEGSHRSPFIVYWEGQYVPLDSINGDVNTTHQGTHTDLFATFGELAGYETPVGLDSRSMAGLFSGGEADEHDYLVWEDRPSGDWAIRFDEYKLLKTGNNNLELYKLDVDPSESNNLLNNPSAQEQTIASFLQQIALDEGLESDIGSNGAQNTHIVQYKSWLPTGGSGDWNAAGNWAGGSEFNTRGTAANNFNTAPANNWIATIDNFETGGNETVVSANSEVLAFEVSGSDGTMTVKVNNAVTLTARNGARILQDGRVELDGGNLETVRTIEIRQGGVLAGRGEVKTPYDTTGTPFTLEAEIVNEGRLEIGGAAAAAGTGATLELIANGGFESGTAFPFDNVDDWFNFTGNQTLNGRNGSNPNSGAFRGIVGLNSNGVDEPAPAQDTGHVIALGDAYVMNFAYAGASQWDEGTDTFTATIYYLDGSIPVTLESAVFNPSLNFGSGYTSDAFAFAPVSDPTAVGKSLFLRFESNAGSAEFASIDDVSLTLPAPPLNILSIAGDVAQTATGEMAFDLFGLGGVAGVDFDQLDISGDLLLAGALEVTANGPLAFTIGDSFELIQFDGALQGTFDTVSSLPTLASGQAWQVNYGANAVTLEVVAGGIAGDFNGDSIVDAADYALWRNTLGSTTDLRADGNNNNVVDAADLDVWRNNFGATAPASSQQGVPEPSAALGIGIGGVLSAAARRR